MVIPSLGSLLDNIKERTTNPFLGTWIVVWLVHNARLVYGFFNVGSDWTVHAKLEYFEAYFLANPFLPNLFLSAVYALIILILTYTLLGLSRLLTELYEKKVLPLIIKVTDETEVVTVEKHNALKEKLITLRSAFEEEQNRRFEGLDKIIKLQERVDGYERVVPVSEPIADESSETTTTTTTKPPVTISPSMYHLAGKIQDGADVETVKTAVGITFNANNVRQYAGGFSSDGTFSFQLLLDNPNDYIELLTELKGNRNISIRSSSSIGAMRAG